MGLFGWTSLRHLLVGTDFTALGLQGSRSAETIALGRRSGVACFAAASFLEVHVEA